MDSLLTLSQLGAFLAVSVAITLSPGPDNLMVLSLSIARGQKAGIAFGLGCALGCINHTVLAALGVSALIAASPTAFFVLKVIGGLYLVWLGVQAIRHAQSFSQSSTRIVSQESFRQLFTKGLIANAINPKVVLFFLAFLPQFVTGDQGQVGWQILQLGLVFTVQAALIFSTIGWFAGSVGERLARSPGLSLWLDRSAGGIFIALGAKLIFDR
jgi:threonine/homoserine/homoserine lactone efflux protein